MSQRSEATIVECSSGAGDGELVHPPRPGQGFRALTERWTKERVERVVELLHAGDRSGLEAYLADEVPRVEHASDPEGCLDLKGFNFDELTYRVDLGGVRFEGLNLWSARLRNVNLKGASFDGCNMGLTTFKDAYLRGVRIADCDMFGCTFVRANLEGVRFSSTTLGNTTFTDCAIDTRAFPDRLEEERRGRFASAGDIYKALRLDLTSAGDTEGASWAAYRQAVLERRAAWADGRRARWFLSLVLDVLWGYGERPSRLFLFSVGFCLIWALLYFFAGLNIGGECVTGATASDGSIHFAQCLYFSFVTFTTLGYGDLSPCTLFGRILAVTQAFSGVFIMGLFVSANVRKLTGG